MSRVRFRDASNVLRTAVRIRVRDASNALRTIQRIRARDGGNVLRTVWQFFSVALDKTVVTGSGSGAASSGGVTSATVTGTVTGGTAAFTYLWQYVSGDATIVPATGTAAATTFSSSAVPEVGKIAIYKLQVTDAGSNVTFSNNVEVQLYWTDTR